MRILLMVLGVAMCSLHGYAQNYFRDEIRNELNDFREKARGEIMDFRKEAMDEFLEFAQNPWEEFKGEEPVPEPKEEPKPPVVFPKEDKGKNDEGKPVVIDEVIPPVVVPPQPEPIQPIEDVPVIQEKMVKFTFFGTPLSVRFDIANKVALKVVDEIRVCEALKKYTQEAYDNLIVDCLNIRAELALSDWAYLQLLKTLAYEIYGGNNNSATLMLGYLYMQSGYKMRYGMESSTLYMLYASKHQIYNTVAYRLDNDVFYGVEPLPEQMYICNVAFPREQDMSLYIKNSPKLSYREGKTRRIKSDRYPSMDISITVNKNLLDFFSTYPSSMVNDNFITKWAMYANTPLAEDVKGNMYPQMRKIIEGKSQTEAVNILLNWVQTGLVYEYDDKVWGFDRAFFAEESLSYPYCDCEDRSILFTRLVRDLLDMKCLLVYYPGHLAAAVNFTDQVCGDYIVQDGHKFIVADPTFIGAPVGKTMASMDNATAKVILLK